MEITNHKKEAMQVVKYCMIIIIAFFYQNLAAQGLQGTYQGSDGITYQFYENTFQTVALQHFAGKIVAGGSYKIEDDTLILNFKPIKDHPKAKFTFLKKEPMHTISNGDSLLDESKIYAHFKIVDEKGMPLTPPPIIQVRNNKNQIIHGFRADSLGRIPEIFIMGNFKGNFHFTSLANEEFTIQSDSLLGYKSKVKVTLPEKTTYRQCNESKIYLIRQSAADRIVLRNIENDKELVLKLRESK